MPVQTADREKFCSATVKALLHRFVRPRQAGRDKATVESGTVQQSKVRRVCVTEHSKNARTRIKQSMNHRVETRECEEVHERDNRYQIRTNLTININSISQVENEQKSGRAEAVNEGLILERWN